MMTGAQTCVKILNPAVNQTTLPYRMTRMGLNPAEEREEGEVMERLKREIRQRDMRKDERKTGRARTRYGRSKAVRTLFAN